MNMVVLPIELHQLGFEVHAHTGEDVAQIVQNHLGEHFASVLCHKDQVNVHKEYTMPAVANFAVFSWIFAHRPKYNIAHATAPSL